jgi:hypothetical protein
MRRRDVRQARGGGLCHALYDAQAVGIDRHRHQAGPGRTAGRDYDAAPRNHLDATTLIEVRIEEVSAKQRTGGPLGPRDADPDAPGTSGLLRR